MDSFFTSLAQKLGGQIQTDHLKLLTCLLATYPSAYLFKALPNPSSKHLFSILFSSYTLVVILQSWAGFVHLTTTCLFTYFFMKFYHGPNGPWINFAALMVSMALCHLDRQFNDIKGDSVLDYSGAMMIAVIKLSGFGFNVLDGRTEAHSDFYKRMAIKGDYPTLVSFFGWMFFFAGLLIGPSFDYMDYIRLVTLPLNETSPTPLTDKQRSISLSVKKPLSMLLIKVTFLILAVVYIYPTYNYEALLTKPYTELPFVSRFIFVQIASSMTRFKFYTVWFLTEGACMIAGIAFNGFDEKDQPLWDRVTNGNLGTEWSPSVRMTSVRWNSGANRWLNRYVYMRVGTPGSKKGIKAMALTYFVSSVWHGFHSGYYAFFLISALLQYVGVSMRRLVRPLLMTPDMMHELPLKKVYDIAGVFITVTCLNLTCASFFLLESHKYMSAFRSVYNYHYIAILVGGGALMVAKPTLIALQKKRVARYQQDKQQQADQVDGLEVKQPETDKTADFKTE